MLSQKQKDFDEHLLCLERFVPQDNFYRQLEAKLDLSFVYDLVRDCYSSSIGRPSIDPVVCFKLQLIMFFEGIRSERQLMEHVNLNLAHRWYIGYDLNETMPDHSSLSKIRERYGLVIFQRFFEKIVEVCQAAGLVWGRELYFDGTKIRANAALEEMVPRWYWQAKQHLAVLFDEDQEPSAGESTFAQLTVSAPGSSEMSKMDNMPMLDLVRWARFRWKLHPQIGVGDTKYGTIENIMGLERDGIRAYLPTPDLSKHTQFYPTEMFHFDPEQDLYVCPQGHDLPLYSRRKSEEKFVYRADATVCNACPLKPHCTNSKRGRHIFRSFYQEYLDQAAAYRETAAYKKALRKRQVWVEPLFGEGKQWHQMARFRLRGLEKVNIEGVLKAAGQNIKRLLNHKDRRKPKRPSGGAARFLIFGATMCAI